MNLYDFYATRSFKSFILNIIQKRKTAANILFKTNHNYVIIMIILLLKSKYCI